MEKRNKRTGEPLIDSQQPAAAPAGTDKDTVESPGTAAMALTMNEAKSETREEILIRIGNRLIEVRAKLGIKQKDFAKVLGVSPSYLSDIELGKTRPSFEFLISCYNKYQLNIGWLLVEEGPMFLSRESGRKICEYNLGDQNDVMHEILRIMEKSSFCRNVLLGGLMRTYMEYEPFIIQDLQKLGDAPKLLRSKKDD